MLIRPKNIPEVYWVGGGAMLLVVLRLVPLKLAAKAVAEGSDVYLFLIGMMLLSELARENGVFNWLSSVAVRSANGSCSCLFTLVYGIGTIVTVFMSNDATAVVLTPAILTAVRKAKVEPLPYLFVCALIANAASFVLPISNQQIWWSSIRACLHSVSGFSLLGCRLCSPSSQLTESCDLSFAGISANVLNLKWKRSRLRAKEGWC